jgi:hypothetical protein
MALSSKEVDILTNRLDGLEIVFYLTTVASAQTDNSSRSATIDKGHEVKDSRLRRKRYHAPLTVSEAVVNPYQRSVPIEFGCQRHILL